MLTTLTLDDELVAATSNYTGIEDKALLVREALVALVERESARRLGQMGGSDRDAAAPLRRQ